jgi:glycosyltransferase involved in cell wall biosynthesis
MISIILPVFNGQNYLQECINSIIQQDFKEFELIIINDGSHDLSEQIILNISDSRIKYFFKINTGLADTLNFGVSKSKFDYICRIDQDDIMRHDRLTKQLEFLQNNPNKMGVCSYALKINSQNKVVGHLKPKVSKKWDEFQLIFQNNLIHSAMMLRKENLLVLGGYTVDMSLQPPEDFELWSRYMQKYPNPFGLIPEFLTYYRINQNSMSRTNTMIEENSVSIGLRNIEYLIKIDLEERRILKSFLSNIHTRRDTNFIFEFFILNSILVKIWREIYPKFNIIDFIRIMSFQIKYSISKPIKQLLFNLLRL